MLSDEVEKKVFTILFVKVEQNWWEQDKVDLAFQNERQSDNFGLFLAFKIVSIFLMF